MKAVSFVIAYLGCLVLRLYRQFGRLPDWRRDEISEILETFEQKRSARFSWKAVFRLLALVLVFAGLLAITAMNIYLHHWWGIVSTLVLGTVLVLTVRDHVRGF
jgi:hypothetical protein